MLLRHKDVQTLPCQAWSNRWLSERELVCHRNLSKRCAGTSAGALRHAFFDTFTTFAVTASAMAPAAPVAARASVDGGDDSSMSQTLSRSVTHGRMLKLVANCGHVRSVIIDDLSRK